MYMYMYVCALAFTTDNTQLYFRLFFCLSVIVLLLFPSSGEWGSGARWAAKCPSESKFVLKPNFVSEALLAQQYSLCSYANIK